MVEVTYKKKKSFKAIIGVTIFIFVVLLATLITVIVISAQKGDDYKVKKTPVAKQTKKPKPKREPDDDEEETDDKDDPNKPGEQKDPNNTGAKKKKKAPKPIKGKIDNTSLVNGSLQVRVTINEVINDGTCELSLVGPREQKYNNTTQIIANSSTTSICNGFDVLINDVEQDRDKQTGKWLVTVNLSTKTRQGKLTSEIIL